MDERVAKFKRYFDRAYEGEYEPNSADFVKLNEVIKNGTLAGRDLATVIPASMKVLRAAGSRVTWLSVLSSVCDHLEGEDDSSIGFGWKTENPHKLHAQDTGRTDLQDLTVTDQLSMEGFSDEEIEAATKTHEERRVAALARGEAGKVAKTAILEGGVLSSGLRGWELVEGQRAAQIKEGLATAAGWDKSLEKQGLWASWSYYNEWKRLHMGERAPKGVNTLRGDSEFRIWASNGFKEEEG